MPPRSSSSSSPARLIVPPLLSCLCLRLFAYRKFCAFLCRRSYWLPLGGCRSPLKNRKMRSCCSYTSGETSPPPASTAIRARAAGDIQLLRAKATVIPIAGRDHKDPPFPGVDPGPGDRPGFLFGQQPRAQSLASFILGLKPARFWEGQNPSRCPSNRAFLKFL